MQIFQGSSGGLVKAWIDGVAVEKEARAQIDNIASMPFIHSHIAIMPDVHWGKGATVGSVIPTKGAIIPAAVGVDIGCGMMAVRTSLNAIDLPDNLLGLRSAIEMRIPHGRTDNGGINDRGAWGEIPNSNLEKFALLNVNLQKILEKHPKVSQAAIRAPSHLGTLGTGNHFVEVCLDENQNVWIMLHSGSRGIGNRIGSYFIERAKHEMRRWFINLPDEDLAYLPEGSQLYGDYWAALSWAQKFALTNREIMMEAALSALSKTIPKPFTVDEKAVNCHHNYASIENHWGAEVIVTRKGAVRLLDDELGIIPGSMGAKSYIVRAIHGLAHNEAFCSCSHGAGRSMSRNEARRRFTVADHIDATKGIECRKDDGVIDETPMAYKDIDAVMAAQSDHVEIVHTLRQVVCVKG